MSIKTSELVDQLADILEKSKVILIQGGSGTGKTYISEKVAHKLDDAKYNVFAGSPAEVFLEVCSVQPELGYSELVYGMDVATEDGQVTYNYKEKLFLKILKDASNAYNHFSNNKFVLILDDIHNGDISAALGEMVAVLDPHRKRKYEINANNGECIEIPPNFYVILTCGEIIDYNQSMSYAFMRRFYKYDLASDYDFVADPGKNMEGREAYRLTRNIVESNLNYQFRSDVFKREKNVLGHSYFIERGLEKRINYQVIPILNQYCKEGILEHSAYIGITELKEKYKTTYTLDPTYNITSRITDMIRGVTKGKFFSEDLTHKPFKNLTARIKEQGLLSDIDIELYILFNDGIMLRKSSSGGYKGNLYGKFNEIGNIITPSGRNRYSQSKSDSIYVCNERYALAIEIQPNDYLKWNDSFDNVDYKNDRGTMPPNIVLFFIIKYYYKALLNNWDKYLEEHPTDQNIRKLRNYAEREWLKFYDFYKNNKPISRNNLGYKNANEKVREKISDLVILWTDVDSNFIDEYGETIDLKGAYNMAEVAQYEEYFKAMDSLNVRQMILQGPPGTSKTYATNEFLKFLAAGVHNTNLASDSEVKSMQITDYDVNEYCPWIVAHRGEELPIAWDIVQFHPSYGYEDFVRGIQVSTKPDDADPTKKYVSYDTVNKILGAISKIARKALEEKKNTKFILIIDEINRANLATVFGELIYGLEYRGKPVSTPYSIDDDNLNKLSLPDNLYIVGTMNTADKSIGGIDYAIRRRFLFFSQLPDREVIENYEIGLVAETGMTPAQVAQKELNNKALKLFSEVEKLFGDEILSPEYYKDDVQIGHTYFLVDSEEMLFRRFVYQILPILREYFKDGIFRLEGNANKHGADGLKNCVIGGIGLNSETELNDVRNNVFNEIIS